MLQQLKVAFSHAGESARTVVGIRRGIEEPLYILEPLIKHVEVRHYGPRLAAQTTVAGDELPTRSEGFRRLAGYIFGANHRGERIAMTAPVGLQRIGGDGVKIAMTAPTATSETEQGWLIRFFMPAKWTMESLPAPDDQRVHLRAVAPESVAVLRFSGSRGSRSIAARTAQLREAMRATGFEPAGQPTSWFYDPPWTLWFRRRNEVAIPIVDLPADSRRGH